MTALILRWHRAFTWRERLTIAGFLIGAVCHAALLLR